MLNRFMSYIEKTGIPRKLVEYRASKLNEEIEEKEVKDGGIGEEIRKEQWIEREVKRRLKLELWRRDRDKLTYDIMNTICEKSPIKVVPTVQTSERDDVIYFMVTVTPILNDEEEV